MAEPLAALNRANAATTRAEQERDEARADYAALSRQYAQLEQEAHNDLDQCRAERDALRALLREWCDLYLFHPLGAAPSESLLDRTDAALREE